jgi:hypothetical protein
LAELAKVATAYWNAIKVDGSYRIKPDWNQTSCDLANGKYVHEE